MDGTKSLSRNGSQGESKYRFGAELCGLPASVIYVPVKEGVEYRIEGVGLINVQRCCQFGR